MTRVVVTGSYSTGKTTLVRDLTAVLEGEGYRCRTADEPIRKLQRELAGCDPLTAYCRLLTEHWRRLRTGPADCCLYDRGLLDLLVHYRLEGPANAVFEQTLIELLQWYIPLVDLFIYLPVEIPLAPDSRRPDDEAHRQRLAAALERTASEISLPLEIVRGSPVIRTARASELVRTLMHRRRSRTESI